MASSSFTKLMKRLEKAIKIEGSDDIHAMIAKSIGVHRPSAAGGAYCVDIPLYCPDGDAVRLYVLQDDSGQWVVTDSMPIDRDYGDNRIDDISRFVDGVIELYGIEIIDGHLTKTTDGPLGDAVFLVAQASIQIAGEATSFANRE